MTCHLEKQLTRLLDRAAIEYTRPEVDHTDPTNLDFYLPDFDLYIEVKQFHTNRISEQLRLVPEKKSAIVLMGPDVVRHFNRLICAIGA